MRPGSVVLVLGALAAVPALGKAKVLLVGSQAAGKSSLMQRFIGQGFTESYTSTIGVDIELGTATIAKRVSDESEKVVDQEVRFQVRDTAGGRRFRPIVEAYYRKADAFILVVSLQSPQGLTRAEEVVRAIREKGPENAPVVLVGTRVDEGDWALRAVELEEFAAKWDLAEKVFYVSAKSGSCVDELFQHAIQLAYDARPTDYFEATIVLNEDRVCSTIKSCF